ncbi:MAG: prolyl oligopeptidase family serine peptidase [Deltaproteobacteria bacterium]|nr:prolyl oligopeptidase family serine peptidase [Deltaproteobacteria bacterium]
MIRARFFTTRLVLILAVGCASATRSRQPPASPQATQAGSSPVASSADPTELQRDLAFLKDYAETRGYRLGRPVRAEPLPDGSKVLFLRGEARKPELRLYAFDVGTGKEMEILTPEQVLGGASEKLSPEERALRERMRITLKGITSYELSRDGKSVLVTLSGRVYVVTLATRDAREVAGPDEGGAPPFDPKFSPDGTWVSFVRGSELWVVPSRGGKPIQLTAGSSATKTHGLAEFVAQEEMDRYTGYWWSPDSTRLVYEVAESSKVERLYLGDPAKPSVVAEPTPYPRPGKPNVDVTLGIVSIPTGGNAKGNGGIPKTTWVSWDRARYPYLVKVTWEPRAPLTILVESRDQKDLWLLSVDPETGATRELLRERDDAWVNINILAPRLYDASGAGRSTADEEYAWLPDGSGFLWSTERGGDWQLELRAPDGQFVRTLTAPSLGLRGIRRIDMESDSVIVAAGTDPLEQHLLAVPLKGGNPRPLTTGPGFFEANYAADCNVAVVFRGAPDMFYTAEVRRADGSLAGELASVAEAAPFRAQISVARVGDDPDFLAAVVRPATFDAKKKYPVLVHVYGGPGHNVVGVAASAFLRLQWISNHGFIVVAFDGRGTPGRGRAWERAILGKLADVPLNDQVLALQALGEREPAMDMTRVGIIGHSFGGYLSALAVIRRPDVFHAAVASAPVVDWLDYDTHYTERYLGVPEKDTSVYEANSVLVGAANLSRPLMIVHGTADDNVHFNQALKLADALFRAGKPFELVTLAGQTHMFYEPEVTARYWERVFRFFRKELGAD